MKASKQAARCACQVRESLTIQDDSIAPLIPKGAKLALYPEGVPPITGDLVVAWLKSGEVLIRKMRRLGGRKRLIRLESINKQYSTLTLPTTEISNLRPVEWVSIYRRNG